MNRQGSSASVWKPLLRAAGATLVVTALLSAVVAGCGGKSSSETPAKPATEQPPATPPPAPAETTSASAAPADLGAKVFATRCALCHGPDGHGDGPGSVALKPKPRNFHDKSSRTDAQLLEVIHLGKGAMPKWGGVLSEAEINAALAHVRELGKKP
jgi:mono/diheme cytochrome c family protein